MFGFAAPGMIGGVLLLIAICIVLGIKDNNQKFKKWLSDQKKTKPINLLFFILIVIGLSFAVAVVISLILAVCAKNSHASIDGGYEKAFSIMFVFLAVSAALAVFGWLGIKLSRRSSSDWRELDFYNACVDNGIKSATTQTNLAKMRLLAEKKGFRIPDEMDALKEFFLRGEAAANKQKQKIEQIDLSVEIKKEREEERKEYISLNAFTDYSGRSKRKQMLSSALAEAKEVLKEEEAMERFMGSLYQKESSWGTAGGIASGIAGPAAGIAAAIDTMQKNAEKRAYNASIAPGVMYAQQQIDTAKLSTVQKIELYKRQIDETDLKLIDESLTGKNVFSRITVHNSSFEVSKTGAVRVKATVSASKIKILDTASGVVDGYLLAEICQKGKKVADAKLRIPMYGLSTEKEQLEGICTSLQDPNAKYSINLTYGKLWVIESA